VLSPSDNVRELSITYDELQGSELAVSHLLAMGRKRIAYVGGKPRHQSTRSRLEGSQRTLAAAGVTLPSTDVLIGDWSEAWGRTAAAMLARRSAAERPDGVFCASDQIARGLVDGLHEAGVSVPEQVSVVGFDNWDVMVEASQPPLTSVDPHLSTLGRLAASRLLAAIDGGHLGSGVVPQPCDLVVRQSSFPG
jgi:LacI family transcriptional regulator